MATLVIIAIVVFIAVMTVYFTKKNKELIAEGKIIQREANFFIETAEIFTLKNVKFSQVIDALKETSFAGSGVSLNGSVQQRTVYFHG